MCMMFINHTAYCPVNELDNFSNISILTPARPNVHFPTPNNILKFDYKCQTIY